MPDNGRKTFREGCILERSSETEAEHAAEEGVIASGSEAIQTKQKECQT
jgi:hypothetical protein